MSCVCKIILRRILNCVFIIYWNRTLRITERDENNDAHGTATGLWAVLLVFVSVYLMFLYMPSVNVLAEACRWVSFRPLAYIRVRRRLIFVNKSKWQDNWNMTYGYDVNDWTINE
jgi:hypothetical protein